MKERAQDGATRMSTVSTAYGVPLLSLVGNENGDGVWKKTMLSQ